jgi:hypothetical protein
MPNPERRASGREQNVDAADTDQRMHLDREDERVVPELDASPLHLISFWSLAWNELRQLVLEGRPAC